MGVVKEVNAREFGRTVGLKNVESNWKRELSQLLFGDSEDKLQRFMDASSMVCKSMELRVNIEKSKAMRLKRSQSNNRLTLKLEGTCSM